MTEQELRALVREALVRDALMRDAPGSDAPVSNAPVSNTARQGVSAAGAGRSDRHGTIGLLRPSQHASHGIFAVPAGAETDGPCLIEPAVACNHCGYCKS